MDCMHDQIIAKIQRIFLIIFTGIGFIALLTPMISAQSNNLDSSSDNTFEIRVEAREVVVPVFVTYKNKYGISELSIGDYHVFEDGVEQPVHNLRVVSGNVWYATDSLIPISNHLEYAGTPKGIWYGPDVLIPSVLGRMGGGVGRNPYKTLPHPHYHSLYEISYSPPSSVEGSCHEIRVTVDRSDAVVYARDEYCNVKHTPFDPLKGTKEGEQLEAFATSEQRGNLQISAEASYTFIDFGLYRGYIAVDLPWRSFIKNSHRCPSCVNVMLLGIVYSRDGKLVTRFSDESATPSGSTNIKWIQNESFIDIPGSLVPSRYVTQIDLSPGSYNIQMVVSDGDDYGRVALHIDLETNERNNIAVSGIVLCKRYTNMDLAWSWLKNNNDEELADRKKLSVDEVSTAPEYHPLVSKGIGFTPTGDTVFHRGNNHTGNYFTSYFKVYEPNERRPLGDCMFSYFEVYEPTLWSGQTKVQYEMRVVDSKTDKTIVDTGLRSADSFVNPGKLIIPIAEEIAIDKLPVGAYRVEVQASDSTGKQTPWRSASFTVE